MHSGLDAHPELCGEIPIIGFSIKNALMLMLTPEAGNAELLEREYQTQCDKLGWKEASAIERLMISRIGMSWLRLMYAENYSTSCMGSGNSFKEVEFADRQLTRANSRYVRAIELLARLRALTQATRIAEARADLMDAKAAEARASKPGSGMRLLKKAGG